MVLAFGDAKISPSELMEMDVDDLEYWYSMAARWSDLLEAESKKHAK